VIFALTFLVFRFSPVHEVYDSTYEMMFSQQLLRNHRFSADAAAFPQLKSHKPGQVYQRGVDLTYLLYPMGDRFYYFFPPGSVILSVPYVAIANLCGGSATDSNGIYDHAGEKRIQAGLATLLMAGLATIIFATARMILPFSWSILIALATAFCTSVWSLASRTMWSHTWGAFILAAIVWLIVRAEIARKPPPPIILATCLSWLFFIRPTFSISVAAVGFYVLIYHPRIFVRFALTGMIWLGSFILFSRYHFGQSLPPYYTSQGPGFRDGSLWHGLAGILVSPARGLLIYVPVLLIVPYLLVRYWSVARTNLAVLAGGVTGTHILLCAAYWGWSGGHCYGARYSTDVVPWLALLGTLAVDARLKASDQSRIPGLRSVFEISFATLLLVCSATLNGIGAMSIDAWRWNTTPTNIDSDGSRLWDWRHPPFLGVPPSASSVNEAG